MDKKERKEMLSFAIKINLIVGIYNLYLYSISGLLFNIVIGSMNIGVWVFFRDVKILAALTKYKLNKN